MLTLVAFSFTSPASIILRMAAYLAGMGMVLPQALAGALQPFPERAGAALSLVGFVQQTLSALPKFLLGLCSEKEPGRWSVEWPCSGALPSCFGSGRGRVPVNV